MSEVLDSLDMFAAAAAMPEQVFDAAPAAPPMIVLEELGLFPGAQQWVDFAVEQLRARRDALMADDSPAKQLAKHIGRTIPLVHGGGDVGGVAAMRWKTEVNENAN